MPHQEAVTVSAAIRPDRVERVADLLAGMSAQGAARNDVISFADLDGVHFARLFVLPTASDLDGREIPATLFYMCDVDAPAQRHLDALAEQHGRGLDALFGHCVGFPEGEVTTALRVRFLGEHLVGSAATYIHTVGRSVDQVRAEHGLREVIEDVVDTPGAILPTDSAVQAVDRIRRAVLEREDFGWAGSPPSGPGLAFRVRRVAHLLLLIIVGLLLLPILLPLVVVLMVLVRLQERTDVPDTARPSAEHLRATEQHEDFGAQNPFTAVGLVKAGGVRRLTMRSVLFGLDLACRYIYRNDNLAGVRTIHFARWTPIDEGRRLVFVSNYDNSLDSYMDDFIDRLAWGLNAVFSNGAGWPRTRWLVLGGARDESAFKDYLRTHQVPTPVWYSAYDTLTARNVDANMVRREQLPRRLDEHAAADWLSGL